MDAGSDAQLALTNTEASGFEVGKHRLYAPSFRIFAGGPERRRRGGCDEPWLLGVFVLEHPDVGSEASTREVCTGKLVLTCRPELVGLQRFRGRRVLFLCQIH